MEDTFDVQLRITSASPYWTMDQFEMGEYLASVNACIDHNVRHIGYIRAIDVVRYFGEDLVNDNVVAIQKKYFTHGFIYPLPTKRYLTGSVVDAPIEPSYILRCEFHPIHMVKPCDIDRLKTLSTETDRLSNALFDAIVELSAHARQFSKLFKEGENMDVCTDKPKIF